MARMQLHPFILQVWLAFVVQLKPVSCWNRAQCLKVVNDTLSSNNSSLAALHPTWFYSLADSSNPILTVKGCEALCDSKMGFYSDSAPRLITWLLPILLLVANMQFAPLGRERFLMIVHLLGDPIHSIWSLLAKIEDWNRYCRLVQSWYNTEQRQKQKDRIKNTVMILSAGEELTESCQFQAIIGCLSQTDKVDHLLLDTARALGESRSKEIVRTFFAILLYVFQIIAAFVPAVGESSSPSGGRIGPAMMYSWLLPAVLLSNAIGVFLSPRNCRKTILQLLERINELPDGNVLCKKKISLMEKEEANYHFQPSVWSGAMYTFNLGQKYLDPSKRNLLLAVLAVLPVSLAFGTAFAVLETAPTYFSCRSILVITIYACWLLSATATWLMTATTNWLMAPTGTWLMPVPSATIRRRLWYLVLLKDIVIGLPILSLIITTSCGMFNSCYCWSGAVALGESKAQVPLNPTSAFDRNNNIIFPAMVTTGLFLQICFFFIILWFGWRGFKAMWWPQGAY